jgi:integrase
MRSALSAFFSWCIAEGLIELNPVTGTLTADEGASRERVLSTEELRALWRGLGTEPFDEAVRLLALLGQRRDEIGALQWSEVDLARKLIILPASRTKNSRQHELPLSRQALEILERQPRRNSSDFVFGGKGVQNWSRAKLALDRKLGLSSWRIHDLRRTYATQMAEIGVQPHIIEAVLNHVSGHKAGVAGTYNRARYTDEMRLALQRWADHLDQIVG